MEFWKLVKLMATLSALALESLMLNSIVPIIPQLLEHPLYWNEIYESGLTPLNSTKENQDVRHKLNKNTTDTIVPSTPQNCPPPPLGIEPTKSAPKDTTKLKLTLLFLSNSLVAAFFASPLSGVAADKFGYDIVLIFCLCMLLIESLIFAFFKHYIAYVIARLLAGISGASIFIAPAAVSRIFLKDDDMRTKMIGVSIILIGFSNLGPVYMGPMYDAFGQTFPFLLLTAAILLTLSALLVSLIVLKCKNIDDDNATTTCIQEQNNNQEEQQATSLSFMQLLSDPLILIPVLLCVTGLVKCAQQPVISLWLVENFNTGTVQRGIIWLPVFGVHVIGAGVGFLLSQRNTFFLMFIGLAVNAFLIIIMPFSPTFLIVTIIYAFINFHESLFRFFRFNHMAYMSAHVYPTALGRVYALTKIGKDATYLLGGSLAPVIYVDIGYRNLNVIIAAVLLTASPLALVGSILRRQKHIVGPVQTSDEARPLFAETNGNR